MVRKMKSQQWHMARPWLHIVKPVVIAMRDLMPILNAVLFAYGAICREFYTEM